MIPMKKIFTLALVLSMALTLTACGCDKPSGSITLVWGLWKIIRKII